MNDKVLERLFLLLSDATEAGRLTESEVADALVLLAADLPRVEPEVRDHVVLVHVRDALTCVYGPMTPGDAAAFMKTAVDSWQSTDSVMMTTWPLTSPALANPSSISPLTPLVSDTIDIAHR